jgi:hypothetical protein|tara:strand:+ start:227 stop:421 length:195 start_codon:yes stop_codon:yes gene_type:complete
VTPKELKAAYKACFATNDGKIVLDDLEQRFGLWRTSYVPDSDETAFREGQRDAVVFIHNTMKEK